MSIRAYKANVVYDKDESFNLWHDDKIVDYLSSWLTGLNEDSCGLVEIPIKALEEMFVELKLSQDDYAKLWQDIQEAKTKDIEYIDFYCF